MGVTTAISWCDSTLNLEMGCRGCELWNPKVKTCYAGIMTERQIRNAPGRKGWPTSFESPAIFPYRMKEAERWPDLTGTERPDKPWLNGLPRVVFLNDMGDTFTEGLPRDWLAPYLDRIEATPHLYLVLTKSPRRMAEFFATRRTPSNMWVGTSVTDQRTADARIPLLQAVHAPLRFLSVEPMLGEVDLLVPRLATARILGPELPYLTRGIGWVIAGGESGSGTPNYRPMNDAWPRKVLEACRHAGIPFFGKQGSGQRTELPMPDGMEIREMPRWP